jgi:hypothetical protein
VIERGFWKAPRPIGPYQSEAPSPAYLVLHQKDLRPPPSVLVPPTIEALRAQVYARPRPRIPDRSLEKAPNLPEHVPSHIHPNRELFAILIPPSTSSADGASHTLASPLVWRKQVNKVISFVDIPFCHAQLEPGGWVLLVETLHGILF